MNLENLTTKDTAVLAVAGVAVVLVVAKTTQNICALHSFSKIVRGMRRDFVVSSLNY